MQLCDDGHKEICFDGINCPMCDLINNHNTAINEKNDEIKTLEDTIEKLNTEVENLQN